jgi:hypothetical protein
MPFYRIQAGLMRTRFVGACRMSDIIQRPEYNDFSGMILYKKSIKNHFSWVSFTFFRVNICWLWMNAPTDIGVIRMII